MDFESHALAGLTRPMLQRDFAQLVGVSPQAVSEWIKTGRIRRGQPAIAWLRAYLEQLREQASGRGDENPLTEARTRLADEQAQATAMKNAVTRREWAPVGVLSEVIGAVARQMRSDLESVVPEIRIRRPDTPLDVLQIVESQVAKAMKRASDARIDLAALAAADDEAADGENDEESA